MRFIYFLLLSVSFTCVNAQEIKFQMHAHNDYEQEYPLIKAMSNNFKSVEVDVFEDEDRLEVSHDDDNLSLKPTLVELYLEPLANYSFRKNQTIFLLIDLKMEGKKILQTLHNLLNSYTKLFKNRYYDNQDAPVKVILSGSVDIDYVTSNKAFNYFHVDGRKENLAKNYDSNLMPMISSNFEDLFCWKPNKRITKTKLKPVLEFINRCHQEGKLVRFWNTPENPKLWDLLIALKVDLIGVDDIDAFVEYATKFIR